jgi:hypothetical protein
VRRTEGYDAAKAVDKLLDAAETRAWMRASTEVRPQGGGVVGDREWSVGVGVGTMWQRQWINCSMLPRHVPGSAHQHR